MTLEKWWQIAKRTKRVYYLTENISRTGMGGSYSLFIIHNGELVKAWPNEQEGDSWNYSESLAKELGFRLSKKWRAWYRNGYGYNKPHDILYSIARKYDGAEGLILCNSVSLDSLNSEG